MKLKNQYILLFALTIIGVSTYFYLKIRSERPAQKKITFEIKDKIDPNYDLHYYPDSLTKEVSEKLDKVFSAENKYRGFHGSVLVSKNDSIIFNKHYGRANFKKKTNITDSSIFQLASVSKQFTATAILILMEQGKLKLEDSVIKYYPNFYYKGVTIKHLLNHTSGLPSYFYLAERKWDKPKPPLNEEMMNLLEKHHPFRYFRPGRSFDYSNTGYFVLASIVEKISGKTLNQFMQQNIFKPLNMKNTFIYRAREDSVHENQIPGYKSSRWRYQKVIDPYFEDGITGDKNVHSTTTDLYRWLRGLNSGKIISDSTREIMYSKSKTSRGRLVNYGYGFRITENKKEKIVYHNGKWNGFRNSVKQFPNEKVNIIVLEHTNYNSINKLTANIKSLVDKHFNH